LNINVSQGSVATRLRCDRIFNDQFITQSLLSSSDKILKIGQHLPKLWAIKYRVVFQWNTVYKCGHNVDISNALPLEMQDARNTKGQRSKVKVTGYGGILWRPPTQLVLKAVREAATKCPRPMQVDLWPFDLESSVQVTCDVGYLCANFSPPRPLYSRLRPDRRQMRIIA